MAGCKSRMYDVEEIAEMLGTSNGYAYKIIRTLNAELEAMELITIPGKVARDYFEQRLFPDSPRPCEGGSPQAGGPGPDGAAA